MHYIGPWDENWKVLSTASLCWHNFFPVTWITWKIMEQCIDVVWKQCAPFFKPIPMPELWWSSQIMDCQGLYIPLISMAQCRSCLFCLFLLIASSPNKLVMMYVELRDPGQQKYYVTPKLGLKKKKKNLTAKDSDCITQNALVSSAESGNWKEIIGEDNGWLSYTHKFSPELECSGYILLLSGYCCPWENGLIYCFYFFKKSCGRKVFII